MLAADNSSTSAIKRLRAHEIVRSYPSVPYCARDIVHLDLNGTASCCLSQADIAAYNAQRYLHQQPGYDVRRIRRADLNRDRHVDEVDWALLEGLSPCN